MDDHYILRDAIKDGEIIWHQYERLLHTAISSSASSSCTHESIEILPRVLVDMIISYVSMAVLPWPPSMSSLICHRLHTRTYMMVSPRGIDALPSSTRGDTLTVSHLNYDRDFPVIIPPPRTV